MFKRARPKKGTPGLLQDSTLIREFFFLILLFGMSFDSGTNPSIDIAAEFDRFLAARCSVSCVDK
jgi:hypothetical protein